MGPVEEYLLTRLAKDGALHITLVDPEKMLLKDAVRIAVEAEKGGTSGIMVGGSTLVSNQDLDETVKAIKASVKIPIILFPNNISGVSRFADAIWFMSLLNSSNTYYLIEAQALVSALVKTYQLEAIPMGYIIVGEGCAAGYIGHARVISPEYPEIVAGYALAGTYLGMRFIYLEAGSGAKEPVPPATISKVKKVIEGPLIVGGGIRDAFAAEKAVRAGADIIVTGSLVEEVDQVRERIHEIIERIRR
mgnify:FL=1